MMLSVALNEKFDGRCSVLDSDGRGLGSEINHIPRRLVLSLFAFWTNMLNNSPTSSPTQSQRELQGVFWCRVIYVH
jgi:hypothetical protein